MTVRAIVEALIGESDSRDAVRQGRLAAWREGYEHGFFAGIEVGRGAALEEEAAQRREAAGLVHEATAGPANAAVIRRRWTVRDERRTRETFGQPHGADYPGQGGAA